MQRCCSRCQKTTEAPSSSSFWPKVDGCSKGKAYRHIILSIFIFTLIVVWFEFFLSFCPGYFFPLFPLNSNINCLIGSPFQAKASHICLDCGFIYTLSKPFEEQASLLLSAFFSLFYFKLQRSALICN